MVYSDKFSKAKRLITQGGDKVAEGIALLLIAKADYAADANASDGVNAADVLNKAIKLFQDNPYMAIGVTKGAEATEAEIKKSFRKYGERAARIVRLAAMVAKTRSTGSKAFASPRYQTPPRKNQGPAAEA